MKKSVLVLCACLLVSLAQAQHTSPEKWTAPRIYHQPLGPGGGLLDFASWVSVGHGPTSAGEESREISPNGAYWFRVHHEDCSQPAEQARVTTIEVFQEREHAVLLRLANDDKCSASARWITEKLIHVRVWWGRIVGSDILFDVEREQVIYHESFVDGSQAFHQFQQAREGKQP